MIHSKSTLTLAVIAAASLTACGGGGGGGGGGGSPTGPESTNWQTDFMNSDRYGVTVDNDMTIDEQTLAIGTDETTSSATAGSFSTPNGNSTTPKGWHGAVSPDATAPDDNPNNNGPTASDGGPFWDGWT